MEDQIKRLLSTVYASVPNPLTIWVKRDGVYYQVKNWDETIPYVRTINANTDRALALLDGFSYSSTVYRMTIIGDGLLCGVVEDVPITITDDPSANDRYYLSDDDGVNKTPIRFVKRENNNTLKSYTTLYFIKEG